MNTGKMDYGLSSLARLSDAETRSISPENPTGEKGGGAREVPGPTTFGHRMDGTGLGKGWKVRPSIPLPKKSTTTIADVKGPGTVQHIWMTISDNEKYYRDCVLRVYWDGETTPSVEAPLGDFFAQGHGMRYTVNSLTIVDNPGGGLNCYWPMPFRKSMKITIENERDQDVPGLFYEITYSLEPVPDDAAYFHAQWRRKQVTVDHPEYTILDGVKGKGQYVGTFLALVQTDNGWWGEGEAKFYIDGDTEYPTICGTGMEDYFCAAWGLGTVFSTALTGYPLRDVGNGVPRHAMYRWHIPDPIRFKKDLRVTIQDIGGWPDRIYTARADDMASTAYWYQTEPHAPFPPFPTLYQRWARNWSG